MPRSERDNGGSVVDIRQSSVAEVAPVHAFDRRPGHPDVTVTRLPGDGGPPGGSHAHDFLVLFYARRADGTLRIDGRAWTVRDGDVFLLAPGQVISITEPHDRVATEAWAVAFPADVIRPGNGGAYSSWRAHPLLFPFALGAERAQRLRVPPEREAAWLDRLTVLDAELRGRRDGYHEAVLAHLTLLLVDLARLTADLPHELRLAEEPLLAAVFDVVERRYHEPISLADVAADLALSPGHLTTVVRRKTGRTVHQWLTERRMQQARVLLTGTDLTVAALAHRVGYPDVSYFIKRFRAEHGMTPAQWRTGARPYRP